MKKFSIYFNSMNFKIFLTVIAILIALFLYNYTDTLIKNLQEREYKLATLYAKSIEFITNSSNTERSRKGRSPRPQI